MVEGYQGHVQSPRFGCTDETDERGRERQGRGGGWRNGTSRVSRNQSIVSQLGRPTILAITSRHGTSQDRKTGCVQVEWTACVSMCQPIYGAGSVANVPASTKPKTKQHPPTTKKETTLCSP